MKRKDIEKAAGEYSGSILGCKGSSVKAKYQSFIDGAEWRINAIWHDAKEPANQKSSILIYNKYGVLQADYTGYYSDWEKYVKIYKIKKWCYMEDLLPIKNE